MESTNINQQSMKGFEGPSELSEEEQERKKKVSQIALLIDRTAEAGDLVLDELRGKARAGEVTEVDVLKAAKAVDRQIFKAVCELFEVEADIVQDALDGNVF